tara:strand:- start:325 stop:513 length:189 start_codon:yes stop_codon:yes gene_type:complete
MTQQQNEVQTRERLVLSVIAQIESDLYDSEIRPLLDMLLEIDSKYLQGFLTEAKRQEQMRYN